MFSEYLLSDWEKNGGGSGGGGGGSAGDGCGGIVMVFLACLMLSTMCNNSRVNEQFVVPSSQQVDATEDVDTEN